MVRLVRAGGISMTSEFQEKVRRLRNAVEPVAAGVYFVPEAYAAYQALGVEGSPVAQNGVARPELKSYFTSRVACLGQAPGEVVTAAFGCFDPRVVRRRSPPAGRSPTGTQSWRPGSKARRTCCSASWVPNPMAWFGSPS